MPDFVVNVYGSRYKITAPDEGQASTAALKLQQEFAQANPRAVGEYMRTVPEDQREQPSDMAARSPLGNLPQSRAQSIGQGAADIGGMGFADELGAAAGSVISGDPYSDVLNEMRSQGAGAQEQNPGSYLTGQVGGGLAQAVAGGVPALLRGGTSLLGRVLAGSGVGGVSGAVHGAGTGTDTQSRLKNALIEGGTGLAVGAALPAIGAGAANLYRAGADALGRRGMPAPTDIMRLVSQYVGDVPTARQNIAQAGPDAMIADAGPGARDFLDATIQRGGPGADVARNAIDQRATAAGQRITGALDQSLGQPEGVTAAQTAIREGSAGARGNAYDAAYSLPIDYASPQGQALEAMIRNRVPHSAIQIANNLMRINGEQSQQILARVDDAGNAVFERMPDVRQIDYITRALNHAAESGEGQGALGAQTPLGRAYQNLSRDIRNNLRTAVPEYGTALETAADPIRRSQAVRFGSRLLSGNMTRDEVAAFADGITGPERQAILQGVRSNLDDAMARVERTLQDPNVDARESIAALKKLSSRSNRTKLATVMGDQEADTLFQQIDEAAHAFELRASTAGNSATARRQNIFGTVDRLTAPGPLRTLASGKPLNATQRMIQAMTGQTEEALQGRQDAIYSGAANLMTQPATPQLLGQIGGFGQRDLASQLIQGRIENALIGAVRPGTALAGPTVQQRLDRRR
jgi:hypothetical protein